MRVSWECYLAEPDPFWMLVTDLTMPHPGGRELIDKVRAVNPGIPILVISSFEMQAHHPPALDPKVNEYHLSSH
jgi:DNA-binding NarL/FixJ family response regulator